MAATFTKFTKPVQGCPSCGPIYCSAPRQPRQPSLRYPAAKRGATNCSPMLYAASHLEMTVTAEGQTLAAIADFRFPISDFTTMASRWGKGRMVGQTLDKTSPRRQQGSMIVDCGLDKPEAQARVDGAGKIICIWVFDDAEGLFKHQRRGAPNGANSLTSSKRGHERSVRRHRPSLAFRACQNPQSTICNHRPLLTPRARFVARLTDRSANGLSTRQGRSIRNSQFAICNLQSSPLACVSGLSESAVHDLQPSTLADAAGSFCRAIGGSFRLCPGYSSSSLRCGFFCSPRGMAITPVRASSRMP